MDKGSVARDTMAVCFATVLLVGLLLVGFLLLQPGPQRSQPAPVQTAERTLPDSAGHGAIF